MAELLEKRAAKAASDDERRARLLRLAQIEAEKIGDAAYQAATIPAGTYDGQDGDVPTAAINNYLVTHEGVSEDIAYKMTQALFDNLDQMVSAHAAAKNIKIEDAAKGMPLPLHPGAERFYREKGLLK